MSRSGPVPTGRVWAVGTLLLAVLAVVVHLARVTWGLDRTDEGQYLLLLADPSTSRQTVFLFGYVLHPLFALLGGDVVLLRVLAVAVSTASAGLLGWAVTRALGMRGATAWGVRGVAAACGLGPLLFFPLTPSYNTLAFWGACVWASGLVLLTSTGWAGILIGVGGVLAAAGKITSGAALAALTAVVLLTALVSRRPRLGHLLAGVVLGAGVALAGVLLLVGHGPRWLLAFYREGARSVSLLQGHEDLLRWDPFPWQGFLSTPALVVVGVALVVTLGRRARVSRGVLVGVTAVVLALVAAAAALLGAPVVRSPAMTAVMWWVPLLAALPLLLRRQDPPAPRDPGSSGARPTAWFPLRPVVVGCLALTPLAYVVGTNGNYWIAQGRAVVFWFAALVLVLQAPAVRRVATTATAALVLVLAVSGWGYAYRYAPPTQLLSPAAGTQVATVSPEGARLRLTAEDAQTSRRLETVSRELHLTGVPMLDVTGASPGYIRQLGGRPVGSTWLLGGYPGSLDAALEAVRSEDPGVMERAWILDAPESRRRIPGLLPALGRSLDRDYETVVTFRHELGYNVRLLRPVTVR